MPSSESCAAAAAETAADSTGCRARSISVAQMRRHVTDQPKPRIASTHSRFRSARSLSPAACRPMPSSRARSTDRCRSSRSSGPADPASFAIAPTGRSNASPWSRRASMKSGSSRRCRHARIADAPARSAPGHVAVQRAHGVATGIEPLGKSRAPVFVRTNTRVPPPVAPFRMRVSASSFCRSETRTHNAPDRAGIPSHDRVWASSPRMPFCRSAGDQTLVGTS